MGTAVLVAWISFGALAFGLRSFVHWRRTGTSGFVGITARPLTVEWLGGVLFAGSLAIGVTAPVLDLAGALAPIPALVDGAARTVGWTLYGIGLAGTLWSQLAMRESWRVGVDPSERTALVVTGPFRFVRNPIYTFMIAATAGLALVLPNALALLAIALLVVGLELHVRGVEEPHLVRAHGDEYRRYCETTGRFLPRIGCGLAE